MGKKLRFLLVGVLALVMSLSLAVMFGCNDDDGNGSGGTVAVESVTLDKTSATLEVGGTVTLTATVLPDNATDKTVTWTTSNAGVATVSGGVVTAVAEGTAVITASAGDESATCNVTVEPEEVIVTQLAAPVISIAGDTISWTAVDNAAEYDIYRGSTLVDTITETSYKVTVSTLGTYSFTVVATSDEEAFTDSEASNSVSCTVARLKKPVVSLDEATASVSWAAVENASEYDVYVNGSVVGTTAELTYALNIPADEYGTYKINVVAKSNSGLYLISQQSTSVRYVKADPMQLEAPELTLADNVITWDAVANADEYALYLDGDLIEELTDTSYTITAAATGTYAYHVVATDTTGAYKPSQSSNVINYLIGRQDVDQSALPATTVYLVGDSTVCSFSDSYYLPRYGYGTQLGNYLADNVTISNLALSGRSSYSFLSEANYQTLVNGIGEGDYLIIGFGHNDEKAETERYTNPNLPYTDSTTLINGRPASFAYTLYNYYIKVALDKGATPILCTPIVRADDENNYEGSSGHITTTTTAGGITYAGGDYPQAIRDLGEELGITVIDLTAITAADYEEIGYEAATDYHAWTNTSDGERSGVDNTHTNLYGAKMNAYHISVELAKSENKLGDYVLSGIQGPSYPADYEAGINPGWVESSYESFDASTDKSTLWTTVTEPGWYGTAMGVLGGNSLTPFQVTQGSDENGVTFTVGSTKDKGKIQSSSDGFAAAFMQIGATANFTISATVTLDAYTAGTNQAAFGIMLRDDIYVDLRNDNLASNYVAAGAVTSSSSANAIFSREGGTLDKASNTVSLAQGQVYELSITKTNQTVICTYTNGSNTYSETYTDFDFVAVDYDYMYICLFATRVTATFSNIQFEITGESVGA